jgi:hypothetical protein
MQVGILKQIRNPEAIVAKVSYMLEAAQRSIGSLKFAGEAVFTEMAPFCPALKRKSG